MNSGEGNWVTAAIAAVTAALTAGVNWARNRRKASGSINTSTAQELWEENRDLRKETNARYAAALIEIDQMRDEIAAARSETAASRVETAAARRETAAARRETAEARHAAERYRAKMIEYEDEAFDLRRQLQRAEAEVEDVTRTLAQERAGNGV